MTDCGSGCVDVVIVESSIEKAKWGQHDRMKSEQAQE